MTFHSDYGNLFLKKDEILQALKKTKILLPESIFGTDANGVSQPDILDCQDDQEVHFLNEHVIELRHQLEQEKFARREIEDLLALLKRRAEEAEERTRALEGELKNMRFNAEQAAISASPSVTFPYATKELEAMQAAALKFWANYTPDKRQPTQKEIGIHISELLGLSVTEDKILTRKAVNLASAIKPDELPDT